MKTYVSDIVTCDIIKKLKTGQNYLIGSEMGSGKNFWTRNKLLPYAIENNKKVLLVVHRIAIKGQQNHYLQSYKEECVKKFKGDIFEIQSYQSLEQMVKNGRTSFIDDYDYIICDEAHYFVKDSSMNPNTVYFYEYLNDNNTAVKVFLTGTYESFSYLPWKNKMTCLKQADYNHSNVKEIYCYQDKDLIKSVIEEKISKGQKVLMIVGDKKIGQEFKNKINAKTYFMTANKKDSSEFSKITENNTFESDLLISTSLICEGVEIKDPNIKTIVLDGIDDLELIAQSSARIRDGEVVLFVNQPSYQKIINRFMKYDNKLNMIEEFEQLGYLEYEQKYGYETIHQSHDFLLTSQIASDNNQNELILKLNSCAVANLQYNYDMYQNIIEVGFKVALKKYFPSAVIYNYDELVKDGLIIKNIIDNFMGKQLFKEEQQMLKGLLIREYGLRKSLGVNKINEHFEENHINFRLISDREKKRQSPNYNKTYWILEKVA
ncbi:DEAD/DEAH box helicase family protein [Anaerosporobacter faecicola]|uniref:DEAD/DEAH box helicase family protein n=1 Tax=Anaerosporobacter faecicola TaxID=2718714 RepID=UPI00143BD025|nr:DEAD/DEAH box helicase family protein [Anaerosporobacter faecicola]